MSVKQISVFVENKPGAMNAMTAVLAEHGVNMRALSLSEAQDFGIVRIITDDIEGASDVLREGGYVHSVTSVLGAMIPNSPGGLNKVLQVLGEAGINVEYMYAFLGGRTSNHAYMIFRVADVPAAEAALTAHDMKIVDQEMISGK